MWKVVGDLVARKGIPIVEFEGEHLVIEDYNSSSSRSDSGNLLADFHSPSGEGPSCVFKKLAPKSAHVVSKFAKVYRERESLWGVIILEIIHPFQSDPLLLIISLFHLQDHPHQTIWLNLYLHFL